MRILVAVCVILATVAAYEKSDIVSARIETCRGCSLNRLPQVKKFVMEDAPFYNEVEVKFINGATPELVVLGKQDQELERINLSNLSRDECNDLLLEKGFTKSNSKSDL